MAVASGAGSSALQVYRRHRARRRRRGMAAVVGLALATVGLIRHWPAVGVEIPAAGSVVGVVAVLAGRRPDRWRRGAEGEQRTAEILAALPHRRWAVWHDLAMPGSRANIDHVVAGRTGVWVIDTKTTRAEVRAGWRSVRFGERRLDTRPVRWETEAVATAVADYLDGRRHGTFRVPVRPLVAVHGRGLRPRGVRVGGVPVIPAEQVVGRLRRGRRRLARRDLHMVCQAIESAFIDGIDGIDWIDG